MTLQPNIPESIAGSIRLPEAEIEPRLRAELAMTLYAQSILSFGKAAELAGESRFEFANRIGERGIARHYSEADLRQDLDYASR